MSANLNAAAVQPTMANSEQPATAAQKVLSEITELTETILLSGIDVAQLFALQRVNKHFLKTINSSVTLQEKMFLRHTKPAVGITQLDIQINPLLRCAGQRLSCCVDFQFEPSCWVVKPKATPICRVTLRTHPSNCTIGYVHPDPTSRALLAHYDNEQASYKNMFVANRPVRILPYIQDIEKRDPYATIKFYVEPSATVGELIDAFADELESSGDVSLDG